MRNADTSSSKNMTVARVAPAFLVGLLLFALLPIEYLGADERAHRRRRIEMTTNALGFLSESANRDGSFGTEHRQLQTGLSLLAFLSAGERPGSGDYGEILKQGYGQLLENQAVTGFAGDTLLPTESHAVAALALCEMIGMAETPEQNRKIYRGARRALSYSLNNQDKAYGGRYGGGWKAEPRAKVNDRKVTAWQMMLLQAMEQCGADISRSATIRGISFMKGSFKQPGEEQEKLDIGGFSYDAEGLPVRSISAAGFYCLEAFDQRETDRKAASDWFTNNPPVWRGPHFYYTQFFAVRAMRLHRWGTASAYARHRYRHHFRRVTDLLHRQQRPDGSFGIPPGNAEYTKSMGGVYATAMAVLILNSERSLLPIDEIVKLGTPRID
ncbi:MAG: hypothetical protein KGZ25_01245 [Planctomycetes bacterium]|nr:hypothetical protein [Planctomycetota bacterium]